MSYFSFNIVGNAIDAYTQATDVTANNIANVGTPGASRQSAVVSEAAPIVGSPFLPTNSGQPGTQGEGAVVSQIARIHQNSYDGLFRGASSSQNFYTTEQQQLTSLQSNFGEPANGVNTAYGALQTAVSNAAANASATSTSQATRLAVLTAAQTFATSLNTASSAIGQQEASVIQQSGAVVSQANTLIDQIASLNGQIRSLTAAGDSPNTYLDQRDYAIDALSQLVPTTTTLQPNGSSLITIDGRPVVNDAVAYHLAPPVIGTSANGTATLVVGFENDPNPSNPTPIPLASGQLGAFTDVYNNKLVPYGQQLDNFASSTANEMNRITQAGVDLNSNAGTALFATTPGQVVTAASISVAITDPTQLPLGLISTSAGSLTQAMNSANNTVSTSVAIDGNQTLRNPPPVLNAATGLPGIQGTLYVAVDGTTQTFAYDTSATANSTVTSAAGVPTTTFAADTIGDFMTNFNAAHFGVSASFDATTQKIAFTRDPNNIDAVHRALQGTSATTPGFTITDVTSVGIPTTTAAQGTPANGLLEALGAGQISGVNQTPLNAYGTGDNGAANALTKLFSQSVGAGALQTTAAAVSSATAGSVTITQPAGTPGAFATVNVGQVLTIVNALTGAQQNVPVTAVNRTTGTITVDAAAPINGAATAPPSGDAITTAQTQTLGATYQTLVTQMALDASTVTTGVTTQTTLAASIDAARQSVDGINIDEETQNLLKFQSAYAAAAKTLSTLNTMMQTTLGLISGG
jgi:flagellar hook-associated protein 1 FlgK